MAIQPWLVMLPRKVLVPTTNDFMKNMNMNENLKNVDPDWSQLLKRLLLILNECKAINQVQLMKSSHTYLENTIWASIQWILTILLLLLHHYGGFEWRCKIILLFCLFTFLCIEPRHEAHFRNLARNLVSDILFLKFLC